MNTYTDEFNNIQAVYYTVNSEKVWIIVSPYSNTQAQNISYFNKILNYFNSDNVYPTPCKIKSAFEVIKTHNLTILSQISTGTMINAIVTNIGIIPVVESSPLDEFSFSDEIIPLVKTSSTVYDTYSKLQKIADIIKYVTIHKMNVYKRQLTSDDFEIVDDLEGAYQSTNIDNKIPVTQTLLNSCLNYADVVYTNSGFSATPNDVYFTNTSDFKSDSKTIIFNNIDSLKLWYSLKTKNERIMVTNKINYNGYLPQYIIHFDYFNGLPFIFQAVKDNDLNRAGYIANTWKLYKRNPGWDCVVPPEIYAEEIIYSLSRDVTSKSYVWCYSPKKQNENARYAAILLFI